MPVCLDVVHWIEVFALTRLHCFKPQLSLDPPKRGPRLVSTIHLKSIACHSVALSFQFVLFFLRRDFQITFFCLHLSTQIQSWVTATKRQWQRCLFPPWNQFKTMKLRQQRQLQQKQLDPSKAHPPCPLRYPQHTKSTLLTSPGKTLDILTLTVFKKNPSPRPQRQPSIAEIR